MRRQTLMRGDDGSMFVLPETTDMPEWIETVVCEVLFMTDGRMITYRPEPLRLTYGDSDAA